MDFLNLFYATVETRISAFDVYQANTIGDDILIVSGMPNNVGRCLP